MPAPKGAFQPPVPKRRHTRRGVSSVSDPYRPVVSWRPPVLLYKATIEADAPVQLNPLACKQSIMMKSVVRTLDNKTFFISGLSDIVNAGMGTVANGVSKVVSGIAHTVGTVSSGLLKILS